MTTVAYRDFSAQSHMLSTDRGVWMAWTSHLDVLCTSMHNSAPSLVLASTLL